VALVPQLQPGATASPLPEVGQDAVEETARRLVDSTARQAIGRGKVERGLVHPYFGELGRALVARWQPDRSVTEKGLPGFAGQLGRGLSGFAKVWKQQAEAYGASGSPHGREAPLTPDEVPLVGNSDLQELALQRRLRNRLREQSRESRRALVRVVQDRSGRLLSVELLRPSRDRAMDRTALEDVRAAAQLLPVPPTEATGDRERLVSLWEFEVIVSITPPVPVVAFEFDLALKHFDARTPLDRRIYKRVRLVEIE
jgi:TonB family protein